MSPPLPNATTLNFFPDEIWSGKEIHLTERYPSIWKLGKNVDQNWYRLVSEKDIREKRTPHAVAGFDCTYIGGLIPDNATSFHVTILMQLPYHGTEFHPASVRARQASEKPCYHAQARLDALISIADHGCRFPPRLMAHSTQKQDENGLVPGGWIVYCVHTRTRGVLLMKSHLCPSIRTRGAIFFDYPRESRDLIRSLVKAAYNELESAKVSIRNEEVDLYWDECSSELQYCYWNVLAISL
ncbi:hypothetical protein FE257_001038 [Aspergillus nanangensis]|uniref:Uncharacterized protein n=1 Tax=Aspergillus nanangensis TaxID=2582783 RepID=A0AAD4CTW2_ASPNN|nr:hypothetical protein FE257_001038 [Aspergillus nanangensis]